MPPDVAGLSEIADQLGVNKRTVQRYMTRDDFPKPVGTLGGRRIWSRADIADWAAKTLPLPEGRPWPKS